MRGRVPTERSTYHRHKHVGICAKSLKRSYRTKKKVLKASHPLNQPWGAYRCKHCGLWHGTTQDHKRAALSTKRKSSPFEGEDPGAIPGGAIE